MARPASPRPTLDLRPELRLVGPITSRIRALRPSLSPTAARIGDAVLATPTEIVSLTVTELADRTSTSVGSVVRFCQDLELKGFHDLKLRLAAESTSPDTLATRSGEAPANTIDTVVQAALGGLQQLTAALEPESLTRIAQELRRATRVLVVNGQLDLPAGGQ